MTDGSGALFLLIDIFKAETFSLVEQEYIAVYIKLVHVYFQSPVALSDLLCTRQSFHTRQLVF